MKDGEGVPLRTMGSIFVARQLVDARLVDRLRLMIFALIAGPQGAKRLSKTLPRRIWNSSTTKRWSDACCSSSIDRQARTSPASERGDMVRRPRAMAVR